MPASNIKLRTLPLPHTSLPAHPSLPSPSSQPPLNQFLQSTLSAGTQLLASLTSTNKNTNNAIPFTRQGRNPKPSSPSTAPVELFATDGSISTDAAEGQWFARRSVHEDKNVRGTASWDEFVGGLRDEHARHEMEYTPSVSRVEEVMRWDEAKGMEVMGWKVDEACVNAITHTFPFPVFPRTFIVLQITATQLTSSSNSIPAAFTTIQLPLSLPHAVLAPTVTKPGILAHYASVEQVRILPSDTDSPPEKKGGIEWVMATTSDAGGSIPGFMQRSWVLGGVPKAIVKDVGLFLEWVDSKRGKK